MSNLALNMYEHSTSYEIVEPVDDLHPNIRTAVMRL